MVCLCPFTNCRAVRPYIARASRRPCGCLVNGLYRLDGPRYHYQAWAALCLSALSRVRACVRALVNADGLTVYDVLTPGAVAHALPLCKEDIFPLFAARVPNLQANFALVDAIH